MALRADDPLAVANTSGTFYFVKDGLGSITDITDDQGFKVQHYEYAAFGKLLAMTDANGNDVMDAPVINQSFSYTGREYDSETELYYYRARYYDASIGRFLQVDPDAGMLSNPITHINKYSYVGNNSINMVDPSGLRSLTQVINNIGNIGKSIYNSTLSNISKFNKFIVSDRGREWALTVAVGATIVVVGVLVTPGNPQAGTVLVAAGGGMMVGGTVAAMDGNRPIFRTGVQYGVTAGMSAAAVVYTGGLGWGAAGSTVAGVVAGEATGQIMGLSKGEGALIGLGTGLGLNALGGGGGPGAASGNIRSAITNPSVGGTVFRPSL